MALIDLQREVQRLCLAPQAPEAPLPSAGRADIWLLYREMVRKRLLSELRVALRRTHAAAGKALFRAAFEAQLAEAPPRSRRFYQVVSGFADATVPRWRKDPTVPAHLADLLQYEAALWEVADMDDRLPVAARDFDFDRPCQFAPALRLLHLSHGVHRPDQHGVAAPTYLCLYRPAAEAKARTWVLNDVTFELMRRLSDAGQTPGAAIRGLALDRGFQVDEAFLDGLCGVLSDFLEAGVLLGSR